MSLWNAEHVGDRAAANGFAVAQQRIRLIRHTVEFWRHEPGALHEFKLARNVGVDAGEMQAARGVVRRTGLKRVFRAELFAILASAAQDAVKASGGDEIGPKRRTRQCDLLQRLRNQTVIAKLLGIVRPGNTIVDRDRSDEIV